MMMMIMMMMMMMTMITTKPTGMMIVIKLFMSGVLKMMKNTLGYSSDCGYGLYRICLVLSCHGLVHTHTAIFAKLGVKTKATDISCYRTLWQWLVYWTYWEGLSDSRIEDSLFITQVITT
jgi:hypothetical protein